MLLERGHRVIIATPPSASPHSLAPGARFRPLYRYDNSGQNPLRELRLIQEYRALFREERPDVILTFTVKANIYGSLAAGQLHIPVISTITGLGYSFTGNSLLRRVVCQLYRRGMRRNFRVAVQNRVDYELFRQKRLASAEQLLLIPGSGVDVRRFRYTPLPERREPFRFLFIGRLLSDKGVLEYVEAARRLREVLPDAVFEIVGDFFSSNPASISPPLWNRLIQQGNIVWHGQRTDVRPYLRRSTVFVLPSYREGLPMSTLEAMSTGRPIITTDAAGCRQTVEPGKNGWMVPVQNVDVLVETLISAYHTSRLDLVRMGQRSREMVETRFSKQIVARVYQDLIDQLVQPARRPSPSVSSEC